MKGGKYSFAGPLEPSFESEKGEDAGDGYNERQTFEPKHV